ncbi:magnesium transport protein transmembrane region [Diplodia corticola]|uniref:Magnesium transport protein transmembrane region n=1 Tax=Diplodia corticola TaxID=236234 RepID=A0A1J9QP56_9PEZI|nr:magnesium transport protein transmembrane region [Diplodia corticola]OJD29834.1 magnesium transport protein transmembrane region [Diplodia corticola]
MLVPLVVLIQETDRLSDQRKQDNQNTLGLEERIGLRRDWTTDGNFLSKTEDAMRQTLELLTMVTNHKADTEILNKNFMDTIANNIRLIKHQVSPLLDKSSRERMDQHSLDVEYLLECLRQSNISIAASFGALQKRVEIQMTALYTLVGQRDSKLNLEMAYDSRRLASASKRDSSSMKTIAVLTTVFLPGTFIATVFSMPMVDYAPAQFWIYLAIAIPLTLVVLSVWAAWMLWIERRNEREDKRAEERLPIYDSREEYGLNKLPALRRLNRVLCQD